MKFTPLTCLALATFAGAALTDLDDAGFMGLSAIEAGALVARDVGPAIVRSFPDFLAGQRD